MLKPNQCSIRPDQNPKGLRLCGENPSLLLGGEMEGLNVSDANLIVHLHPSKSNNIYDAILRELSSLLFKYFFFFFFFFKKNFFGCFLVFDIEELLKIAVTGFLLFNENFDGVVLAYEFNILDKNAKILIGIHPFFGVRLKAKLLLFSPKPDMLLEGKVVKLSQGSIHLIVLGFSSATIIDEDIREEFLFKTKHEEEIFISKFHKRHVIKIGNMLRFLVKSFDEEILHISGSLVPPHTGSIWWLDRHSKEVSQPDRGNKSREAEEETILQANGTVGGTEVIFKSPIESNASVLKLDEKLSGFKSIINSNNDLGKLEFLICNECGVLAVTSRNLKRPADAKFKGNDIE
ncbi:hypothetical protein FEM48_Zijuj06G0021300 [Ziziphus jujuba var. spinosa]|uniref:DNA-directed RNA polymerase subunit n=1 Tax=Ziziphus jujuba var. spinosa TaxID=714518 RepID=A0A978V6J7_ZIZJJ|nr:hypothetical protein FEM48_Zijuj06G0021300 [Ziziphus jujuba var. spinosa]